METQELGRDPRDPASWAAQDRRRLLRLALHVDQLQAATMFYSQFLGLTLVAPLDVPGASVQRALVAADLEPSSFGLELLSGGPAMSAMVGDWSGFLVLTVPDRAQCLQSIAASGQGTVVSEEAAVIPVRNPSPEGGRTLQDIVSVVQDVNGYRWNLVQTASHHGPQTPERIIAVGITVPDVALAISWCVQVLGMLPLQQYTSLSGYMTGLALGQAVDTIVLGGVSDPTEAVPSLRLTGPGNLRVCFVQQAE
ncbi:hypothetical protein QBZ16_003610 [Prototheca wickerhamii]|uniref:VOC domain-containing protein n=1 Tax=Prototheca wickerhamii TaxID=3111 RepID=A0AAD9ILD6_PROWI|nr:hypothetical protein QBZ16_003610 [Prototheca wickerhamii]